MDRKRGYLTLHNTTKSFLLSKHLKNLLMNNNLLTISIVLLKFQVKIYLINMSGYELTDSPSLYATYPFISE